VKALEQGEGIGAFALVDSWGEVVASLELVVGFLEEALGVPLTALVVVADPDTVERAATALRAFEGTQNVVVLM